MSLIEKVCEECGIKFAVQFAKRKQKFHSRDCADRAKTKRNKGMMNSITHPWQKKDPIFKPAPYPESCYL